MARSKSAISLDAILLEKSSLARECAKLDPLFEKGLAEEGLSEELFEWLEY